jgi:predicted esterase
MINFTRREFCAITLASLAVGNACRSFRDSMNPYTGRLTARPQANVKSKSSGRTALGLDSERHAILHIPKSANQAPLPLLVMLHGATQSAEDMFWYLGSTPDENGVVVLAPNSRDTTWDAIRGSFGFDVEFVNRALERTFATVAIDPQRVAIGGFSDGASYAVSLGLINGDLFSRVVAFSPGFVIDGTVNGKPRFFISHGTHDRILPIDGTGRRVAASLKARGYEVTFREFDGDHEIPEEVAREALKWVAG